MGLLRRVNNSDDKPWGWLFWCMGCRDTHHIPVEGKGGWGFNGDEAKPTFTPSILNYEVKKQDGTVYSPRCHIFVTNGEIVFLGDCGHDHAGKTVAMVDVPDVEW
jgi:hypothetical protein